MRHADSLAARRVAIIGERELADGAVTLKTLGTAARRRLSPWPMW